MGKKEIVILSCLVLFANTSFYVFAKVQNDEEKKKFKNPFKQLVQGAFRQGSVRSFKKSALEKQPNHPFFQERRLARACNNDGDNECSETYSTKRPQHPPFHAFAGMQLQVFRLVPNHSSVQYHSKNELPPPDNKDGGYHEELSGATESNHIPQKPTTQTEGDEKESNDDSFIYVKGYELTEPLFLELGVAPRHQLDFAYSPTFAQQPPPPKPSQPQTNEGETSSQQPEKMDIMAVDDATSTSTVDDSLTTTNIDDPSSVCTDVADNVFSNWWKWWLPWDTNVNGAAHGSQRSEYYETFSGAFAGGSHGEVWRGRRICREQEVCDDEKPLILKRLRVEQGYLLLEAGLREIYIGQWIRHELPAAQQTLYTTYVDHFFREVSLPRAFGRSPKTRQLELWVVFEDAGPSLRSYLYNPISSDGGFVIYQPSHLWSLMRTSNKEKQQKQGDDSSTTIQTSQHRDAADDDMDDTHKTAKEKNFGREFLRTVLRQILSAASLLHENGIIHRDIKPSNVLCTTDVELKHLYSLESMPEIRCKLGDFSSIWDDQYISENLYTKGPSPAEQTDEYAPPESYIGPNWVPFDEAKPQSYDSWSIGVLVLELLLGTPNVFSVDQRTTALLTNKMKKQNASEEEIQRALHLAALSQFCIYMPSNNSTKQQSWPLSQGDPLHNTAMVKESCTLQDFHRALRARDPLGIGFDSSTDLLLHLVWQLLAWEPKDRMTAAEALHHPYFNIPEGNQQSQQWKMMSTQHNSIMEYQKSDPRFVLSSKDGVEVFTCPKCGRTFFDWRSCHIHANARKHAKFCTYDRTFLPTCINTHSMLPAHPTSGYCDLQGRRSVIEDFHSIHLHPSVQFYGMFDGHTGNLASKYVASSMYDKLVTHLDGLKDIINRPRWKEEVKHNVSLAFQEIHEDFLKGLALAPSAMDQSGTTATALLVTEEVIVISSLGDSRAILSSSTGQGMSAIQLTKDHVASDPDERELVVERGGTVSSSGGIDRVNGTLAITRSIGDASLSPVLSRIPTVVTMTREEIREACGVSRDIPCFVVLASDGLWDVMSNQEAIDMVAHVVASYDATDRVSWNNGGAFQEGAEVLAIDAYVRGSSDNIGVCVVAVD